MKALFIGGSGVISSACAWEAVAQGIDLTLLNRGKSTQRQSLPKHTPSSQMLATVHLLKMQSQGKLLTSLLILSPTRQNKLTSTSKFLLAKPNNSSLSALLLPITNLSIISPSPKAPPSTTPNGTILATKSPVKNASSKPIESKPSPSPSSVRPTPMTKQSSPSSATSPLSTACSRANPSSSSETAPPFGPSPITKILRRALLA